METLGIILVHWQRLCEGISLEGGDIKNFPTGNFETTVGQMSYKV